MEHSNYDAVIVGGGPNGLALAGALLSAVPDLRLAIVDRRPFVVPEDRRAFALSTGVVRLLAAIGVWPRVVAEAQPILGMRITDSGRTDISRPVFLTFDGEVRPGEPIAHMVPNRVLTAALLDTVGARAALVAPATIHGLSTDARAAVLSLADGGTITAPLIVAADGAQSALRGMAGIGTVGHDYGQSGIVTTIAHAQPHAGIAYEHFRPAGPFASLPLPGNRSSLVWTETPQQAARLKALPRDAAAAEIEAAMGSVLGAVTVEEPLQAFPLRMQLAREFVAPRLALVGDAAHVVHPLAGQGLNLGFKDIAALAEVVVEALRLGLDAGAPDVLERYQRWRRLDTSLMAAVTDNLNRLFSNDAAPLRAIRDFGLSAVDRLPAVKSALIGAASGLSASGGPKLLSGLPL